MLGQRDDAGPERLARVLEKCAALAQPISAISWHTTDSVKKRQKKKDKKKKRDGRKKHTNIC
jgi:hypothetical protein